MGIYVCKASTLQDLLEKRFRWAGLGGLQGVYCAGCENRVSLHLPRMGCAPPIRMPPSQHRLGSAPIVAFCHIAPCSKQHDFGSDIIPGAKELGCKVQAHLFKG